jgi:predicted DNA-binding protein with PD1-like motif
LVKMQAGAVNTLVLRLQPGEDLRDALEAAVTGHALSGAFVLAGVGSLSAARLRMAGADAPLQLDGDLEILTLSGSLANDGAHLHAALARADGSVLGGHVAPGCTVRTTVEVLLASLPQWQLSREPDARTGHAELVAHRRESGR